MDYLDHFLYDNLAKDYPSDAKYCLLNVSLCDISNSHREVRKKNLYLTSLKTVIFRQFHASFILILLVCFILGTWPSVTHFLCNDQENHPRFTLWSIKLPSQIFIIKIAQIVMEEYQTKLKSVIGSRRWEVVSSLQEAAVTTRE